MNLKLYDLITLPEVKIFNMVIPSKKISRQLSVSMLHLSQQFNLVFSKLQCLNCFQVSLTKVS